MPALRWPPTIFPFSSLEYGQSCIELLREVACQEMGFESLPAQEH